MKQLKRLGTLLLAVALILSLAACASSANDTAEEQQETVTENPTQENDTQTEEQPQEQTEEQPQEQSEDESAPDEATDGNSALVVYFSRTGEQYNVGVIDKGNTAIVADMIIEVTGADSFEIVPEEDYPYTYDELIEVAKQEQNENARPAYAGEVPDLSRYDTIFIGAPVWWGYWPMICYTFFEENRDALAGKTLIPFSTHAGSGLSGFDKKLASACPDSIIGDGLAIAGTDAQNNQDTVRGKVNDWLGELGY